MYTDSSWWLEHGLDGVVGAVLAGLATAGAVWVTLRSDRRKMRQELQDRESLDLAKQARHLRELAMWNDPQYLYLAFNWTMDINLLKWATEEKQPCFASLLAEAARQVSTHGAGSAGTTLKVANSQRLTDGLVCAERLLQRRVHTPEYFTTMNKETCERLRKAISEGATI